MCQGPTVEDDGDDNGSVYDIAYHLAWIVDPGPVELDSRLSDGLREILHEAAAEQDTTITDLTVTASYVHLVVQAQPNHSPNHLVTWFKNVSAKRFEQTHPENGALGTWADDHFAGTAAEDGHAAVRRYLKARLATDTETDG
jgi:putative transposase